jgi:hypothetical protein
MTAPTAKLFEEETEVVKVAKTAAREQYRWVTSC